MLIITILLLKDFVFNIAMPRLLNFAVSSLEALAGIIVCVIGILALLSAVGLKFHPNPKTPSITGVIINSLGYLCTTVIKAIGWLVRTVTLVVIPRVFNGCREFFSSNMNLNAIVSNLLAILVTIIVVVVII